MNDLSKLAGLGPKSVQLLNNIGIKSRAELEAIGPVAAYLQLKEAYGAKISLNFLYAMVGGLEGVHWSKIARQERDRLLAELDGYARLEKLLQSGDGEDQ